MKSTADRTFSSNFVLLLGELIARQSENLLSVTINVCCSGDLFPLGQTHRHICVTTYITYLRVLQVAGEESEKQNYRSHERVCVYELSYSSIQH